MPSVSAARAKASLEVREKEVKDRRGPLSVLEIDNDRLLLKQSYNLRYQVYCLERKFLRPADYPDQQEIDKFDKNAIHLGVLNAKGDLVGTARLVHPTSAGLPMFPRCTLFADVPTLDFKRTYIVETGRLAVSRRADAPERRMGNDIIQQIFKGGYQASKRHGFTHWVAAFENSLQRLMSRYGFPWRPIGPQVDYYGLVAPYLLSLDEFDGVIVGGRRPALRTFLDGLESQFRPVDVWKSVGAVR